MPAQGTRSHMAKVRVRELQLKILHAATKSEDPVHATKTWHSQIHIKKIYMLQMEEKIRSYKNN